MYVCMYVCMYALYVYMTVSTVFITVCRNCMVLFLFMTDNLYCMYDNLYVQLYASSVSYPSTNIHTNIHTYIHTYIHTLIYTFLIIITYLYSLSRNSVHCFSFSNHLYVCLYVCMCVMSCSPSLSSSSSCGWCGESHANLLLCV